MTPVELDSTREGWCLRFEHLELIAHRVVLGITAAQEVVTGGFSPAGNLVAIYVADPAAEKADGDAE